MNGDDNQDWKCWLRLMLTSGLGNESARKLLARFGQPQDIFETEIQDLKECISAKLAVSIKSEPNAYITDQIARTSSWLAQSDNTIVYLGHPHYPSQLLEIPDPPTMLYVKGDWRFLHGPILAVVGSRNASVQGIQHAEVFAHTLSDAGWCISSGLAAGVDTAAHRGGLQGPGGTVAVIGTGVDIVYPARNRELVHQIVTNGCIVSEYHLGAPAQPANFPRRNRIISGLARGVLVVEAAAQSGSLITARMAAEQGRDVFAIPGSIHSPLAKGCHLLIKQGAKLVESAQDILEEFNELPLLVQSTNQNVGENSRTDGLLAFIGYDPIQFDTLLLRTGYEVSALTTEVFELEMQGVLETLPGGLIQRIA